MICLKSQANIGHPHLVAGCWLLCNTDCANLSLVATCSPKPSKHAQIMQLCGSEVRSSRLQGAQGPAHVRDSSAPTNQSTNRYIIMASITLVGWLGHYMVGYCTTIYHDHQTIIGEPL